MAARHSCQRSGRQETPALWKPAAGVRKSNGVGSGKPNETDALQFAASRARGILSKFEPCLPDRLLNRYLAERLTEYDGASGTRERSLRQGD